ncbi:MAG TPA: DUF1572 family protein [Blastocatellia bacterium]|nr:DUF1572 family protein [Blastocatellia bacterium]
MEQNNDLSKTALEAIRSRITRILPAQIRSCVEELSEEQLWWRPNEQANSVGNLVLHLSGSMRHYLSNRVGGMEYERNRPAEFAERGPVPKQQLLATFDETIRQAGQVLDAFDTSRFLDATDEPNYVPTIFDLIFNIAIHLATHAGQIVYVTKMLKEGSLDELWIRAHRTDSQSVER